MNKGLVILSVFLVSSVALAKECSPEQAIKEYYGGPEIKNMKIEPIGNGDYSIELDDEDGPAHCSGGVAHVSSRCEVTPIQALYCEH